MLSGADKVSGFKIKKWAHYIYFSRNITIKMPLVYLLISKNLCIQCILIQHGTYF